MESPRSTEGIGITMKTKIAASRLAALAVAAPMFGASQAHAVNYTINWLDMSPTAFGSSVPNNSVFTLPGVGNVTVSYSIPANIGHIRQTVPQLQNGNVTAGPDNYAWGAQELFGATNNSQAGNPLVTTQWAITYTFSGAIPANTLYVGAMGIGRTNFPLAGDSLVTVNQNGTFLGDWSGGGPWGATLYTGGPGTFNMTNSQVNAGGQNPWWNSQLGVVQINDVVSSLTIIVDQLPGDGLGVNIGSVVVPTPGGLALLGLGGALAFRRRR